MAHLMTASFTPTEPSMAPVRSADAEDEMWPASPSAASVESEPAEAQQAATAAQRSWIMSYMQARSDDDGSDESVRDDGCCAGGRCVHDNALLCRTACHGPVHVLQTLMVYTPPSLHPQR